MLFLEDEKDRYQQRLKRDSQQDFISSDKAPLQNDDRSEFTKGLDAGIDQTAALGGGLLAMFGSATGSDASFYTGMDYYNEQMNLASDSEADIGRLEDIEGFDDFLSYAAYTAGNAIPSLATALIGGGVGGAVAKAAVKKGVQEQAKEYAKKRVSDRAADGFRKRVADDYAAAALSKKAGYGAAAGAYLASTGMGAGESFTRILEQEGEEAPGVALITGMVSGGLDAIAPMRALKRIFPKRQYDSVVRDMGKGVEKKIPFYSRALKEMGKQAGVEGVTEGMQEIVQQIALEYVENNHSDLSGAFMEALTDETKYSGYLNAAAAGVIGGGMFGGATGGFGDPSVRPSRVSSQQIDAANEQADPDTTNQAVSEEAQSMGDDLVVSLEEELAAKRKSKQEDARKNIDAQDRYAPLFDQIEARRTVQAILEQEDLQQEQAGRKIEQDAEQATKDKAEKERAETVERVRESPVVATPLKSMQGKNVTYQGVTGILNETPDGFVVVAPQEDIFIESGEAQSAESLGVTLAENNVELEQEITFDANDSTFTLRDKKYKYSSVRKEGGRAVSVQAFDEKGNRRNIKEPRIVKLIEQKKADAEAALSAPEASTPELTLPPAPKTFPASQPRSDIAAESTSETTSAAAPPVVEVLGLEGERVAASQTARTTLDKDEATDIDSYNRIEGEVSTNPLNERAEAMTSGVATTVQQRAGTDSVEVRPFGGRKKLVKLMASLGFNPQVKGIIPVLDALGDPDVALGDFDSDTPAVKAFVSAVMEIAERGMPQEFLFGTKGYFVSSNPDRIDRGGYHTKKNFVVIGQKLIDEAVANGSRRLSHAIAHEHWHHADNINEYSGSLPAFRVSLSENQDGGAPQVEMGSITQEIYELWRSGDEEIGQQFRYPLQMFGRDLKNAIAEGKEQGVLRVKQQEIFAQLGAIYLNNPGSLKIKAPKAYAMIRSIIQNPTLKASEVINGKGEIRNDRTQPVSSSVQRPVRTRTGGRSGEVPDPDGTGQASAGSGGQGRTDTGVEGQSDNGDGDASGQVVPLVQPTKQEALKAEQQKIKDALYEKFLSDSKKPEVPPQPREKVKVPVKASTKKKVAPKAKPVKKSTDRIAPTAKKSDDFDFTGDWNVEMSDGAIYQIFYDADQKRWFLGDTAVPGVPEAVDDSVSIFGIGSNKKEAFDWLQENHFAGKSDSDDTSNFQDIKFDELSEQSQKVTASKILYGADDPLPIEGNATVVNISNAFDARTKEAYPDRDLSTRSEENIDTVSDLIAHEAMEALSEEGNAGEWYQEKVANAMDLAAQRFPELKTDPNAKFAFTAIMAVTSNGASVPENSVNTFKLYEEYRDNKVFTVFGVGKEANAMKKSFALLNDLIIAYDNDGGLSGLRAFMDKDVTVKELEQDYNLKVSGELKGTKLKGSAILGPKVGGGFYQNLNGNYTPLTMDRWFMRTYGRLTGSLMSEAQRKLPAQIVKFRETALSEENRKTLKEAGIKRTQLKNDDDYVVAYAKKVQGKYARGGFKEKSALNKASNTLKNSQQEQQDPRNGGERVYIREVMTRALEKVNTSLTDRGDKPVNMGALQAIVWYPEKELYKLHGYRNKNAEPTDYETEFRKIIEGEGPGPRVSGPDGSSQQPRARGIQPATRVSEQDETLSYRPESKEPLKARPSQVRSPAIEKAVQQRIDREITAEQFNEIAEESGRPVREMVPKQVPDLVTDEKALAALYTDKRKFWNQPLQNGVRYGARLDIPAYSRPPAGADPADIVTVHYKKATAQSPKASDKISHMKTIRMKNVEFAVPEKGAKKIALGRGKKNTIATIEGDYVQQSDEINHKDFKSLMNDPDWTQVSMNPERHAFFYALKDQSPVLTADEVIQVGNLVIAKNVNDPASLKKLTGKDKATTQARENLETVADDFLFAEFPKPTGEIVEVFAGSNAPHPSEIEPYDERGPFNIFGGVFGSTRREVAESNGDFIKKYDVDTGMILEQRDLDNDEISVQLAKRLGISQDEASDVLTSYKREEFSNDDAARLLGMSDSGEASWDMQAKIGDAARKAGYDAVELPDEYGTSILVLNDRLAGENTSPVADDFLFAEFPEPADLNAQIREENKPILNRVTKQFRKYLTPEGLLPKKVFEEKIKRDSELGAVEMDIRRILAEYDEAVSEVYNRELEESEQKELQAALTTKFSEIDSLNLDPAIKNAIIGMRRYMDHLSIDYAKVLFAEAKQLSEQGVDAKAAAKIDLLNTIASNVGSYANRSYRAFDDPKWANSVSDDVLNTAREYLTDSGATNPELVINEILKEGTAFDSMESFIKESKLGAKDLSILKRRKDIAPEIRALLGEYSDPKINFAKSANKMSRLLFNDRFLKKVKEIGMDTFFYDRETAPPEAYFTFEAESSDVMAPLNGLKTTPEIAQAFKDALGKEQMADWYRGIVQVNGAIKYGKTVIAPTTLARNYLSAYMFTIANGHFNIGKIGQSIESAEVYFKGKGEQFSYVRRLKELGVVYDTPYAGEMMALLDDAKQDMFMGGKLKGAKWFFDNATKLYQYGDDLWKIVGFENEIDILMDAKGISREVAEPLAAKRIRDTYPTYSLVGSGVQKLRRFPLAGTFVSFPAEIIRTGFNIVKYLKNDLADPDMAGTVPRRIAGLAMASGGAYALQEALKNMIDVDDDEEEAVRLLGPKWSENSNFAFIGRDKGTLRYVDLSAFDPYNYFKRPINALLRDQPVQDALYQSAKEALKPFFGTDIAFQNIIDVYTNEKVNGGSVFNESEGSLEQLQSISYHLLKGIGPSALSNVERFGKALEGDRNGAGKVYKLQDEMAALGGFRVSTLDPKVSLYFRAYDFNQKKREATKILTGKFRDVNEVSDRELNDAFYRASSAREEAFEEMIKIVSAAKKAGLNRVQTIQILRSNGVSKKDAITLSDGEMSRWEMSDSTLKNSVEKADLLFGEATGQRYERRWRLIQQLLAEQN